MGTTVSAVTAARKLVGSCVVGQRTQEPTKACDMTPSNGSARGRCRRSARRPTQAMRRPSSQPLAVGSRLPTTAPQAGPASPPALAPRLGRGAGEKTRYRARARTGGNPHPLWHSPAETGGGCAGLQAEEYQGHGTAEGDESPAPQSLALLGGGVGSAWGCRTCVADMAAEKVLKKPTCHSVIQRWRHGERITFGPYVSGYCVQL